MCGINGGWLTEGIDRSAIDASLNAMVHRGPDDAGVYEARPAFIGMRRLSIIDLAGGHQPMFNEDRRIAVVFNGEIYNYRELIPGLQAKGHTFQTKSDTEVLVHLYEEYGTEMCASLRGMFAFAIWDGRDRTLFVARDRFGKKPLYYTRTQTGGLLFASELKALVPLMQAAGQTPTIRQQAIYDFLSLGYVPQPDTIYENVSCLPPGAWMRFDGQAACRSASRACRHVCSTRSAGSGDGCAADWHPRAPCAIRFYGLESRTLPHAGVPGVGPNCCGRRSVDGKIGDSGGFARVWHDAACGGARMDRRDTPRVLFAAE